MTNFWGKIKEMAGLLEQAEKAEHEAKKPKPTPKRQLFSMERFCKGCGAGMPEFIKDGGFWETSSHEYIEHEDRYPVCSLCGEDHPFIVHVKCHNGVRLDQEGQ